MLTLYQLYRRTLRTLKSAGLVTPETDAKLLLEHATGTTQLDLIVNQDMEIDEDKVDALDLIVARRIAGEPVHRILGWREFHGLRLALSPGTLEPRPDTETLVDAVVPHLKALEARGISPRIIDLGTGTGAIALALLKECRKATAVGVDISEEALATAGDNASSEGISFRFEALRSDWFAQVEGKFHAIVSNPPYIRSNEIAGLQREVRMFDPAAALDGGPDGLTAYRILAAQSASFLQPDGIVAIEIGHDQQAEVTDLFEAQGYIVISAPKDLGGNDRVLVFRMAAAGENE